MKRRQPNHLTRAILRRYRRDERIAKIAPQLTEPQRTRILSSTSKHRAQRLPRGGSLLFVMLEVSRLAKAARRNAERAA